MRRTVALLGGGLIAIAVWVRVELRARQPLVDMRMMRLRGVWTTNVAAFLVGMGMYSAFIVIPQFVQEPASTGYGFGANSYIRKPVDLPTFTDAVCGMVSKWGGRKGSGALVS